ncbi:hypothetical protein [Fulvimonas yonginensis]|uniref:Uncharacterized protein n=1 Tax=Fulvimonas yonginensis TaxID=1495200 RepID=A0ABU8JFX9_9GAMM
MPKLAKCHVYPESISAELGGEARALVTMSLEGGGRSSYARAGMYDREIVCPSCEELFKDADDCAIDFRRRVLGWVPPYRFLPYPDATIKLPIFPGDSRLLHQFAVQSWLRAHLSNRFIEKENKNSDLERIIAKAILDKSETIDLGIQVAYVFDVSPFGRLMMNPISHTAVFPMYELAMGRMTVLIASTDKGLPPGFRDIALNGTNEALVYRTRRFNDMRLDIFAEFYSSNREKVDRMFQAALYKGKRKAAV